MGKEWTNQQQWTSFIASFMIIYLTTSLSRKTAAGHELYANKNIVSLSICEQF
jgi:hypothetical protein